MMRRQSMALAVPLVAASALAFGLSAPAAAEVAPEAVALTATWAAQGDSAYSGSGTPTLNAGASEPMRYGVGVTGVPSGGVDDGRLSLVFPPSALSAAHVTAATLAAGLTTRYGPVGDVPTTKLSWSAGSDGSLRLDTPVDLTAGASGQGVGYWMTAAPSLPDLSVTGQLRLTDGQGALLAQRAQSLRVLHDDRDVNGDGRDDLMVRDGSGNLYLYRGTGQASAPFEPRVALPWSYPQTGYRGFTVTGANPFDGLPMAVARCASSSCGTTGLLEAFSPSYPASGQTQAMGAFYQGTAWRYYTAQAGVGDVTGDGRGDLLSRDSAGVLWISPGAAGANQPFRARVEIGSGWNQFDRFVGAGDVTGDGRADLLVRDSAGVLYLYRGTGSASPAFLPRVEIGSGWNQFDRFAGPGDVTGDGRPDLVVRNGDGVLWLYRGTGDASSVFLPRTEIGSGWNQFSELF